MLRLSRHAQARAAERGITMQQIQRVISAHDVSFTDTKGNPCYIRGFDDRRIKVVVAQDDPEFVITVIDLD